MRHGYHMGLGYYGSYILVALLFIICILAFLLLRSKSFANPFLIKLVDILKAKYASGSITADEYIERKSIIEDIKYSNPFTSILIERYARIEISTKEFLDIKDEIESNNIDRFICEQLAKGEISYYEFKLKKDRSDQNEK